MATQLEFVTSIQATRIQSLAGLGPNIFSLPVILHVTMRACLALTIQNMSLVTRNPVSGVSDQVRLKPACASTEAS